MPESRKPSEVFPDRLRAAREHRDLSQSELAKRTGLQASAISHFENKQRKPSFDNLRRLADALDVTTDYLVGRVNDFKSLATGGDTLHRDFSALTTDDRDMAKQFLALLAKRQKDKDKEIGD
jgi:transcriptional regulator with XRE-family HTH domain